MQIRMILYPIYRILLGDCRFLLAFSLLIINNLIILFIVGYVKQVIDKLKELNYGSLATIMGRYYAMDRDKRWERIKIAFEGLVQGKGEKTTLDKCIDVSFSELSFF